MNRIQASLNLLTEDSVGATIKVKENNTVVPADCLVEVPFTNIAIDFLTRGEDTEEKQVTEEQKHQMITLA